MSRTISAELKSHLAQEVTTLARCWKITRTDSTVLGFTDHDVDLVIGAVTYYALPSGQVAALQTNDSLEIDSSEFDVVLNSAYITEDDIRAGLYDSAIIWLFAVNYEDLTQGTMTLAYGYLGEVTLYDHHAKTEFRSLAQMLGINIGRSYLAECDAQLGDARCGLDLDTLGYYDTGTVSAVTDRATITTASAGSATNYPEGHGRVQFTSGANNGLSMAIKSWPSTTMTLVLPMPFNIAVDDTFKAYYGCKKTLAHCRDVFDNVVNFRGFPYLPGTDEMLKTPDAK